MKQLITLVAILMLCIQSCQKEISVPETQQQPVCYTMEVMESLSPEMKAALSRQADRVQVQSASLVLYLDFDGAVVSPGFGSHTTSPIISQTRNFPPAPLTPEMMSEVVELVKDDFSPFNIIVTTDISVFLAQSPSLRHICIISTVPAVGGFAPNVGGIAPFNCSRIYNSPSFVFASLYQTQLPELATVISHEVGHTIGLEHQSVYNENCQLGNEYHPGFGSGPVSFHPIMGASTNIGITNWFDKTCSHLCGFSGQNDFLKINDQVQLKADDFPDQLTDPPVTATASFDGTLEKQLDIDIVKINFTSPGSVTITSQGNVDLKVTLLTIGGFVLGEYDVPGSLNTTIPSAEGLRFLKIEAGSNPNVSSQFLTGKYHVSF
jgi:hypothetical protein